VAQGISLELKKQRSLLEKKEKELEKTQNLLHTSLREKKEVERQFERYIRAAKGKFEEVGQLKIQLKAATNRENLLRQSHQSALEEIEFYKKLRETVKLLKLFYHLWNACVVVSCLGIEK